jgi:DNA-binding IclR family transcriptional regulator
MPRAAATKEPTNSGDADFGNTRVQVVERSIDILNALSAGPCTLTEICRSADLSKGTAFRLLAGLGYGGFVIKDPISTRYMLGPGLLRLSQGALAGMGAVARLGRPSLERLADETQETVAVHVLAGFERVCIDEIPSPQPIRYVSSVGSTAPIYVGSAGKLLLASITPQERTRMLDLLENRLAADRVNRKSLEKTVAQIAVDGYTTSTSERVVGATAISVPIRTNRTTVSLSVLGPADRLPMKQVLSFLPAMKRTVKELEAIFNEDALHVMGPSR